MEDGARNTMLDGEICGRENEEKLVEEESKWATLTADDKRNLVGLFALLIKVDKRVNPHFYKPVASGIVFPMQAGIVMA